MLVLSVVMTHQLFITYTLEQQPVAVQIVQMGSTFLPQYQTTASPAALFV
jgi:hypothetical protein